jgi:DNA-directed RNA polymerase specialized sigma24 family protein
MEDLVKYLKALVALQVKVVTDTHPDLKMEVLLHGAGLSNQEIADLVGKTYPAVAKAISRSKAA